MTVKSILVLVILVFLGISCSKYTYLQVPLTLEESIGQQNVLVETTAGKKHRFDYIEQKGDKYNGIKKASYMPLSKEKVNAVYLRLDDVNNATVKLRDGTKIKGYLLEVKDSAVVLAFGDRDVPNITFPVKDIQNLNIRKNGSVRRGYLIGTGIGLTAGAVTASILIVASGGTSGFEIVIGTAFTMLFGTAGSLIGLWAGGATGHKVFDINGSMTLFEYNRSKMEALSFEHEGYVEDQ